MRTATPLVAVLAACSPLEPRTIELQVPEDVGWAPWLVTIVDATSTLASAGVGPFRNQGPVVNPDGRLDALHLEWLGGICDERVKLAIDRTQDGLDILMTRTRRCGEQAGVERSIDRSSRARSRQTT